MSEETLNTKSRFGNVLVTIKKLNKDDNNSNSEKTSFKHNDIRKFLSFGRNDLLPNINTSDISNIFLMNLEFQNKPDPSVELELKLLPDGKVEFAFNKYNSKGQEHFFTTQMSFGEIYSIQLFVEVCY